MNLMLTYNKGFRWTTEQYNDLKVSYKGYIYNKKEIICLMKKVTCFEEFISTVNKAEGCFAFVIQKKSYIWAAVDQARSIPIFYSDDGSVVADCADVIRECKKISIDNVDLELYAGMLAKRYSNPGTTVYKEIKQLRPGEAVELTEKQINKTFYYLHERHEINDTYSNLKERFLSEAYRMIKQLEPTLYNKRIILPLSGGYDSRLIATLLKKMGHDNILCYTYGRKEDYEVIYSKKVADALGYEWYCVEYTRDDWRKFFKSTDVLQYFSVTHNHCNVPHIQDFMALNYLKENNLIHDGDVVIPGFCGDFPAGSFTHNINFENYNIERLAKLIYEEHFVNVELVDSMKKNIISSLEEYFNDSDVKITNRVSFISAYEKWLIESRLSMWVVNSVRVYEHFNLEWRLPMWDKSYLDFWYSVPSEFREKCDLYQKTILNGIFNEYDIAFVKPKPSTTHDNTIKSIVASIIKKHLIFVSMLINKDIYRRNNINNYNEAAIYLLRELKSRKGYRYDSLSVHLIEQIWWCQKLYGITNYNKVVK